MWTVLIKDQTTHSVQSDLDLHCLQKLPLSSTVRKELYKFTYVMTCPVSCRCIKSLPNNKSSDWSKLKELADDKINVAEKVKFGLERI